MKRMTALLSGLLMLCLLVTQVYAVPVPDMNRVGSVSVTFVYEQKPVAGGSLTLYRVAEVSLKNSADYSFRLTEEYAGSGVSLENLGDPEIASDLAIYAAEQQLEGVTLGIGEDGKVCFEDLPLGVYLLVQQEASDGFEKLSPFLVTVPGRSFGDYVYDVDASPKMALVPIESEWPYEPTDPNQPQEPTEPDLPQTGLTQWPVPVLAVVGLLFVALGWILYASGRGKHHEG